METYKKVMWGSVILAIIAVITLIVYFFFIKKEAPPPPPPAPALASGTEARETPSPVEETPVKGESDNPLLLDIKLNESDGTLREVLADCSPRRDFKGWLRNKDLVRRFVAAVDNVAGGESPAPHLAFLVPTGKFRAIAKGDNIYIDPASYGRYDSVVDVFVSLDTQKLVNIFRGVKPLADEAYKELGYPGKNFTDTLFQAFSVLINTPVPEGDILLVEKVTSYAFSDPGLENLSAPQKHLLRMGPGNAKKIQEKLSEIAEAIREIKEK